MKIVLYIIGVCLVVFLFLTFILKVNNSGVGKYVPINQGMILNTTNGNVYKIKENGTEYIWEKIISFDNDK